MHTHTQTSLDRFEVTIDKLYRERIAREHTDLIESLCPDQPSLSQVRDAWQRRKVLIYSPAIDNPVISTEARDKLSALIAIKHAELNADFTMDGRSATLRSLASDVLEHYGVTDYSLEVIRILNAVLIGPIEYMTMLGHYPINEKAFCLDYLERRKGVLARHY